VVRDENGRRFLLAYDVEKYEESFSELLWILGMAFLIAMVLSVMVIHLLGTRALASIEGLAESVKNPPDGSFRHAGMEAEVAALAAALDDYRAQQSLLLQREQEFSAHLSHELRTPLSVVRAQAEIIRLRHGDDTALAARADTVMEQVDRMRQLIEQLLRLARSQRSPERREIRLRPLVERIWSELEQANQSATRLDDQLDVSALVLANPLLLELILRNVLANARLHANGSTLKVSCDGAVLVLGDYDPRLLEQPEVVAAHLPDEKMPGIGLSILERACRLLGWQCRIERLPTGTRVALTITD
jgi:signal transduction histidine kinase